VKFDPNKLGNIAPPEVSGEGVLTAADLRAEHEYQQQKQWQHNRMLHGYGVVSGLEVLIEQDDDSAAIIISPGYALDGWGRELIVAEPLTVRVPRERRDLIIYLTYFDAAERNNPPASSRVDSTRGSLIAVLLEAPPAERAQSPGTRSDHAIAIARVRRPHLVWQRDRSFRPPRTR
jgi:hypothetical protein